MLSDQITTINVPVYRESRKWKDIKALNKTIKKEFNLEMENSTYPQ